MPPLSANDASTPFTPIEPTISENPSLAALFLIRFDQRVGYTIAWHRAIQGLDLEGVVEFKSLPSGLHNVEEDLIYFVHDTYAGLSAFKRGEGTTAERNSRVAAVGCLVSLSYGRLGRIWLHVDGLKELANGVLHNDEHMEELEQYWARYGATEAQNLLKNDKLPAANSKQRDRSRSYTRTGRGRGMSESVALTAPAPGRSLPMFHPALSIPRFFETVGPLVFPLYRAALLRKRILYVGTPPVHLTCDFVYSHSVLSSIPQSTLEALQSDALARIRPVFSIGVHDIPMLEETASRKYNEQVTRPDIDQGFASHSPGWIACTTDEIISTKPKLYDVRVELATPSVTNHVTDWPSVYDASGKSIKSTQRDYRRFKTLRQHFLFLKRHYEMNHAYHDDDTDEADSDAGVSEHTGLRSPADSDETVDNRPWPSEDQIVEPAPWASIAYDAYVWWASAGEQRAELEEEDEEDRKLLDVMSDLIASSHGSPSGRAMNHGTIEMAIVAYFHRMTVLMFTTLLEIVRNAGFDVNPNTDRKPGDGIIVDKEDLVRMGLDVWSQADRLFVGELVQLYFGLQAEVRGASVECCGVKIY